MREIDHSYCLSIHNAILVVFEGSLKSPTSVTWWRWRWGKVETCIKWHVNQNNMGRLSTVSKVIKYFGKLLSSMQARLATLRAPISIALQKSPPDARFVLLERIDGFGLDGSSPG
jgi:hypothetical protein